MPLNDKRISTIDLICAIFCFALFIFWLSYPWIVSQHVPDFQDRGIAGDLFGGFTALFSALAFAGLIYTLLIQKEELSLQREELKRLADEQSSSSESLKKQLSELARTRNQTTFFQLLDEFRNTKMSISKPSSDGTLVGSRAIQFLLKPRIRIVANSENQEQLQGKYNEILKEREIYLAPYLRAFFAILRFISKSDEDLQPFYSELLTSQLTNIELILIMMHGASDLSSENKDLINRLEVLRNLDTSEHFKKGCFALSFYATVYEKNFIMPKAN